ncbi:MAG: hypothetical protein Q4G35_03175 [Propionibacteriaceae bacterium]|nr:hypothetical protein [Propionibacteriaceae bacterium]
MNAKLTALIPTQSSSLYDSFGLDIMTAVDLDNDETATDHVEWIDGGEFTEALENDLQAWRSAANDLAEAHGYRIDWNGQSEDTGEYIAYPVERLTYWTFEVDADAGWQVVDFGRDFPRDLYGAEDAAFEWGGSDLGTGTYRAALWADENHTELLSEDTYAHVRESETLSALRDYTGDFWQALANRLGTSGLDTLADVADELHERYADPEGGEDASHYLDGALMLAYGDDTLEALAEARWAAHAAYEQAHQQMLGAMVYAARMDGVTEAQITRDTRVARMTVRKALGL